MTKLITSIYFGTLIHGPCVKWYCTLPGSVKQCTVKEHCLAEVSASEVLREIHSDIMELR